MTAPAASAAGRDFFLALVFRVGVYWGTGGLTPQ